MLVRVVELDLTSFQRILSWVGWMVKTTFHFTNPIVSLFLAVFMNASTRINVRSHSDTDKEMLNKYVYGCNFGGASKKILDWSFALCPAHCTITMRGTEHQGQWVLAKPPLQLKLHQIVK